MRCSYCDTAYAFTGGEWRSIADLVDEAASWGARHVCVTGGEPLAQSRCHTLLAALCDRGFEVSLETSGAIDVSGVDPRVCRVVDIKTPGSGEAGRNLEANIPLLGEHDVVKFVICDRADYEWARDWLAAHPDLPSEVYMSPSSGQIEARELGEWILEDRLNVRLQLQLHKLLWGDEHGR